MADSLDIGGEDAAPQTIMEAVLKEGHPPKKNQPPEILPSVIILQPDDVLAKEKGVQGDVDSPSISEELISHVAKSNQFVDQTWQRVAYLQESHDGSVRGLQHQPKNREYAQKFVDLINKLEESSAVEVLSKEKDPVFLRQLLEDMLDSQESSLQDAEKGGVSHDPVLAALAAAPSCHRRGNADEMFAPIPYQW